VDLLWKDPAAAVFVRRLASFSRLIRFDRVGTGASDPVPLEHLPPWESYAEELAVVLDEVGSQGTALLVGADAGPMAISPRPDPSAPGRSCWSPPALGSWPPMTTRSGSPTRSPRPSWASLIRCGAPSHGATGDPQSRWRPAVLPLVCQADAERGQPQGRAGLRAGAVGDRRAPAAAPDPGADAGAASNPGPLFAIEHGRFLAEHIAGAKLVELAGSDWGLPWQGADAALDHIEQFLGGLRRPPEPTRVLATVLFTDISATNWVGSTCRSGRGCTPARSSSATATSVGSPCTLRPG
jgi:hypothetical protein